MTETGELRAFWDDEVVGEIPATFLTDECPRYEVDRLAAARPRAEADPVNLEPKEWIYEQYDQLVLSRTVRRPGLDAAVLRLRPSWRGLAVSLDGPPPGCRDPREAGRAAVLGAARNVACAGGEPLALTDCLNFGNPEKPEIGWELAEAIEGIAEAAEALGIPVVSGNVSLYNETDGRAIPPTPVVGCVGLVPDVRVVPRGWRPGDAVWLAEGDEVELIGWLWRNALEALARPRRRPRRPRSRARRGVAVQRRTTSRRTGEAPSGSVILAGERPDWPAPARAREGRLMCGVFGIRAPERDVARLTYFGLFALQHRGQESAGIAVSDHGRLTVLRDMGLVTQVFDEQKLSGLHGDTAIGHTRYSTTGSTHWANAQPLIQHGHGAHGRARPQRQPRQRDGAARAARGRGRHARHDLRHRADRGADRERRGAARGRGRRRDGAGSRARSRSSRSRRDADRLPRPARLPAARASAALSTANGSSPPRPARSTSSAPSSSARSRPASSS